MVIELNDVRQHLFNIIKKESNNGKNFFSLNSVFEGIKKSLDGFDIIKPDNRTKLMNCWVEMLSNGEIGQYYPDKNDQLDTFFVTETGENLLRHSSRDPMNPSGYIEYLKSNVALPPIAMEYVEEAIHSYRMACYKAASVMIGAAIEVLVVELRNEIRNLKKAKGESTTKLDTWKAKEMLDSVMKSVTGKIDEKIKYNKDAGVGVEELESFKEKISERIPALISEFRRLRNEAGHPGTLKAIEQTDVHSNLLLFPNAAKTLCDIKKWVESHF